MKDTVRKWMFALGLDLTRNQQMDRLTYRIVKRHLKADSNVIDVGCHKGEVLEWFLKLAPQGKHIGFEPIPQLFERLRVRFAGTSCIFYNYALAAEAGETEFVYVPEAPAYSGLRERDYDGKNVHPQRIPIQMRRLDDLIPETMRIDLIKIDVEGGEYGVLRGAAETLKRNRPLVIFEHGKGASDHYGTTPRQIMELFTETGMQVYALQAYLENKAPLSLAEFEAEFELGDNYYFVAR